MSFRLSITYKEAVAIQEATTQCYTETVKKAPTNLKPSPAQDVIQINSDTDEQSSLSSQSSQGNKDLSDNDSSSDSSGISLLSSET